MHKKYRDEHGLFIAEGDKCVNELLKRYKPYLLLDSSNCSSAEIEQMSNMRSPQGVIGVFHIPSNTTPMTLATLTEEDNIILVLDGIQDPGDCASAQRQGYQATQHIWQAQDERRILPQARIRLRRVLRLLYLPEQPSVELLHHKPRRIPWVQKLRRDLCELPISRTMHTQQRPR